MLTEIADECRHSTMFVRGAETFGAPSGQPSPSILRLGRALGKRFDGMAAHPAILVAEGIPDVSSASCRRTSACTR